MNTLQEINSLDNEIATQISVTRYAGHKYILDGVVRTMSGLVIIIGTFINPYLLVFGVLLLSIAIRNFNKSYKELQAEERALIELQGRRSAVWVEVMSSDLKTS